MDDVFRRLSPPSWPDPRAASPAEEQYSRVTDPERYRVVHLRARAWAEVLGAVPGVSLEDVAGAAVEEPGRATDPVVRAVRVAADRAGTLPLFLLEREVELREEGGVLPSLHLAVGRLEVVVDRVPDCGCDACDSGSADLVAAIDETVAAVVSGPYVVLRAPGWGMEWRPGAATSGGTRRVLGHDEAAHLCARLAAGDPVRLPPGVRALVGRSWRG